MFNIQIPKHPHTIRAIFRGANIHDLRRTGRVQERGLPPGVDGADAYLSENWNMIGSRVSMSTCGTLEIQR